MNSKTAAIILLESALSNFEKFKTFLERAWEVESEIYSSEVHDKVNYLHFYLQNSIENLKGGEDNEEAYF